MWWICFLKKHDDFDELDHLSLDSHIADHKLLFLLILILLLDWIMVGTLILISRQNVGSFPP